MVAISCWSPDPTVYFQTGGSAVVRQVGFAEKTDIDGVHARRADRLHAPDIFLEAARRIGIKPERCRAFEDTDLGMQAIRSAGMDAVDVRLLRESDLPNNG
jgi:beta-phosphoglucomutase-like phosphatase (HAD superfamily)